MTFILLFDAMLLPAVWGVFPLALIADSFIFFLSFLQVDFLAFFAICPEQRSFKMNGCSTDIIIFNYFALILHQRIKS